MNSPVRKTTPEVPSDAAARIKSAQLRAEKELSDRLDAFWQNCPESRTKRVSPQDLVPLFERYAGALFNAHAEEYRTLFDDDDTREQFLRRELPEIVVNEILPPAGGSKSPGSFDGIGLRESLGMYRDRIDIVVRSATPKPKEIWEYPGYGEIPDEEFSEHYLGEGLGFDLGFSEAEGTWEKLTDDACDGAIQARSYFPYSRAMVWALRDSRNRSEVREILLASLQDSVTRWLQQAAKFTLATVTDSRSTEARPEDSSEVARRTQLLADYKSSPATKNPSNKRIYEAFNSGIHKPQFYEWLRGELPATSSTAVAFERFLNEKRPPQPRKPRH